MKSTGLLRKVNKFGHFFIPTELRLSMGINKNDSIEFFIDGDNIIIKKHQYVCVFCGNTSNTKDYNGKQVCQDCVRDIYNRTRAV